MAENNDPEKLMRRKRNRLNLDTYSALFASKSGMKVSQLERQMEENFGYPPRDDFGPAGVSGLLQVLREHPNIQEIGPGVFKANATEDNIDCFLQIASQKERKKKGAGARRSTSAVGFGRRGAMSAGGFLRHSNRLGGHMPFGVSVGRAAGRTFGTPAPFGVGRKAPTQASGFGSAFNQAPQKPASSVFGSGLSQAPPSGRLATPMPANQRPLLRSSTTTTSSFGTSMNFGQSSTSIPSRLNQTVGAVKPASRPSAIPSIVEFSDNVKRMMVKVYPDAVHLSELTDLYTQEIGVTVEPLLLFSKSWMMLVQTTFKEFLESSSRQPHHIGLKSDWMAKYGERYRTVTIPAPKPPAPAPLPSTSVPWHPAPSSFPVTSTPLPPTSAPFPATSTPNPMFPPSMEHRLTRALPTSQGFRYQPPKSPTEKLIPKMRGLTVAARKTLPTPEKPPGLKILGNPAPRVFEENKPSCSIPKSESELSFGSSSSDHEYDNLQLRSLKSAPQSPEIIQKVNMAVNEYPRIQQNKSKAARDLSGLVHRRNAADENIVIKINNEFSSNKDRVESRNGIVTPLETANRPLSKGRLITNGINPRLFNRALADLPSSSNRKPLAEVKPVVQNPNSEIGLKSSLYVATQKTPGRSANATLDVSDDGWVSPPPKNIVKAPVVTRGNHATQKTGKSANATLDVSDDGWLTPPPKNIVEAPVVTRKMQLPPVSKVSLSDFKEPRSRKPSPCNSWEEAMRAKIDDDTF